MNGPALILSEFVSIFMSYFFHIEVNAYLNKHYSRAFGGGEILFVLNSIQMKQTVFKYRYMYHFFKQTLL